MSDFQCDQHGGTIKNTDHQWVCCEQEKWAVDSYEGKPTRPADMSPSVVAARRALVEQALKGAKR